VPVVVAYRFCPPARKATHCSVLFHSLNPPPVRHQNPTPSWPFSPSPLSLRCSTRTSSSRGRRRSARYGARASSPPVFIPRARLDRFLRVGVANVFFSSLLPFPPLSCLQDGRHAPLQDQPQAPRQARHHQNLVSDLIFFSVGDFPPHPSDCFFASLCGCLFPFKSEEILNPSVPMALRLSGILMGEFSISSPSPNS
jgi:hypothetical protein